MRSLEHLTRTRTTDLMSAATAHYGRRFAVPEIRFDLRGGTAGEAAPRLWLLRFNRELLSRYGESFIEETVPHEVAHLVASRVYGRCIAPHGSEWRAVMEFFGAEPSRCHNFEFAPTRRLRTYRYRCGCREHWLTSIRHNRARRGTEYLCKSCRGPLRAA